MKISMKIAYLIAAHNNPMHLQRLIKALSSPSSKCFVHIDKKADPAIFSDVDFTNVILSKKSIPVYWGEFSQVRASILLLEQALKRPFQFDRFVLLSGVDYPLRANSYIEEFFERNPISEYISTVQMPDEKADKPIYRLTRFKYQSTDSYHLKLIRRKLKQFGVISDKKVERDYTRYLKNLRPYGGWSWWALTRNACQYILNFVKRERAIVKFFKNTLFSDEMFFHTILANSSFMPNIKPNLTFTDWHAGGPHPALINEEHLTLFSSTPIFLEDVYGTREFLFTRKFSDDSVKLVDLIDQQIADRDGK
jgi:hypothetical protein